MFNLKKDIVNELHKPARKNYPRRHVVMKSIDDLWQADLVELGAYKGENKGFTFLLTVIDCFSKFAFAVPVRDKTGQSISHAMETIFVENKRIPKMLQTDNGREFYCKPFKELLKKYNVHHYSTFSHMKVNKNQKPFSFHYIKFNFHFRHQLWNVSIAH